MKKQIKKIIAFLFAFSMLSLSGTATVFASNAPENTVTYEGKQYTKNALSQETIDWLEIYNKIPEEQRGMINHAPYDLRVLQAKGSARVKVFEAGSELGGTSLRAKLQPGVLGGYQYSALSLKSFMTVMNLDSSYLGNRRAFISGSETDSLPSSKAYKVALAFDKTRIIQDYHYYTQNSNGY